MTCLMSSRRTSDDRGTERDAEEEEEFEAGEELGEEDALVNPEPDAGEEEYSRALTAIRALIKDCADGRSDREAEALRLAKGWNGLVEIVRREFAEVRARKRSKDYGGLGSRRPPMMIEAKAVETSWAPFSSSPTQPEEVAQPEGEPKPEPTKVEAGPPSVAGLVLRRADPSHQLLPTIQVPDRHPAQLRERNRCVESNGARLSL